MPSMPGRMAALTSLMAALLLMSSMATAAGRTAVLRTPASTTPTPWISASQSRFIVRWAPGTNLTQRQAALASASQHVGIAPSRSGVLALQTRRVRTLAMGEELLRTSRPLTSVQAAAFMQALSADATVAHVEPDRLLQHTGVTARPEFNAKLQPDDPFYAENQWNMFDPAGGIRAPAAWDHATGEGVVVAVLDTGITAHEDLDANMLAGYDFITDARVSRRPTDGRAAGAQDYGDWNDDPEACAVSPSSWHGTHVAGTVAEMTNNSIGMVGVAFNARVLPVRVLGRCGGFTSDIADAIVWAAGGAVPGIPANTNPAEVINMSLSGGGACTAGSAMQSAVDAATALGTLVVAGAGNSNDDVADYSPASCANVIAVAATRITGTRAEYSNFGARVDIAAPGGGGEIDGRFGYVFQTWRENAPTGPEEGGPWYVGMAGTSMATPHVAAVAALVQSVAPTPLAPAQMRELLKLSARWFPAPIPAATPIGAGILDAEAAVAAALAPPCNDCEPPATPLVIGVPFNNLTGASDDVRLFKLAVPTGARTLRFLSHGGTGNVSLWVSRGAAPTATDADHRSARAGNNEVVAIPTPQYGTYYVALVGVAPYARVTLEARF